VGLGEGAGYMYVNFCLHTYIGKAWEAEFTRTPLNANNKLR